MTWNTRKEIDGVLYCSNNHPLTEETTFSRIDGRNECKTCRRASQTKRNNNCLPETTESVMNNYKEPLRSVEGGFGYYGTLAFDKDTQTHVQCHVCGSFFKEIGSHVIAHEMTIKEYKEKFGLPLKMYIKAPKYKTAQWLRWHSKTEEEKAAWLEMARLAREKANTTHRNKTFYKRKSLHQKNLEGRCPDQLLDKIEAMANDNGKTPSFKEFSQAYGTGFGQSVQRTFGTWTEAVKILNLTPRETSQPRHNRDSLLQILIDFKLRNKREAVYKDTRFSGQLPSGPTFSKFFGSWGEAKEAAYGGK